MAAVTREDFENAVKSFAIGMSEYSNRFKYTRYDLTEYDKNNVWTPDENMLSQSRILHTIGLAKSRFPIPRDGVMLDRIICYMTPLIKERFLTAYRRLQWLGKSMPTLTQVDEWGRIISDTFTAAHGVTIKMCDPADYGPLYLSFRAVYKRK